MQRILQVSDFHIKAYMVDPEHNAVFYTMIEKLKSLELNEDDELILVYNGDVIDCKEINKHIASTLSNEEKAQKWDELARLAYNKAEDYFVYLINQLGIKRDKIIICCGNHDVNNYYSPDKAIPCYLPKPDKRYAEKRFGEFTLFCQRILGKSILSYTYTKTIGKLNFLVINSNWINKRDETDHVQPLCIGCQDVVDTIEKEEAVLNTTKNTYSRLLNVIVAHAPRTDYCENSLYKYPGWDGKLKETADTLIDRHYGLKLYGDKHTDSDHNFDYIVGAPLDSEDEIISCGIHEFDEKYHHSHRSMTYQDGEWIVRGSEKDIERVLAISRSSIKGQALDYLFDEKNKEKLDLVDIITKFEEYRLEDKWNNLDALFRASGEIKDPITKKELDVSDGFITTLTRIISETRYNKKQCLTVRGDYRVGKSVCMTVLYLNLLFRYSTGTIEYVPVYIDIGTIKKSITKEHTNINSVRFGRGFSRKFNDFLSKGIEYAKDIHRPACIIIDGIDQFTFYDKANLEKIIWDAMQDGAGKDYKKVVYCLDNGPGGMFGSTIQEQKESQFIMYMDRLNTKRVLNDNYPMFIDAFCKLRGVENEEDIIKIKTRIDQLHILEIDTNLLLSIWKSLTNEKLTINENTYFQLIERIAKNKIRPREINVAAKLCRRLISNNGRISYENVIRGFQKNSVSHETFEIVRTQREIGIYLKALNYCNCIMKAGQLDDDDYESVNELLDNDVCSFIRSYFASYKKEDAIINFAKKEYDKLSFGGQATISYLLGRLDEKYKVEAYGLLQDEDKILDNTEPSQEQIRLKKIAKRSIVISSIFVSQNDDILNQYIRDLISNDEARKVNRQFYLQYYGDRDINSDIDEIYTRMDIFHTYHLLANRLKKYTEQNKEYTLLSLELFTLCDLLQERLDSPEAKKRKEKDGTGPSYFYDEDFCKPNSDIAYETLLFIRPIISKYISMFGTNKEQELFIAYLKTQDEYFEACLEKLKDRPLNKQDGYNPVAVYDTLTQFKDVKRLGWYFATSPEHKISSESIHTRVKKRKIIESDMEHTFECFLIGMLYLPESSPGHPDYNKQEILNMLMIHDLGEIGSGDILSFMEDEENKRAEEKRFNETLYVMGIKPEISNLTGYLDLWTKWDERENYNAKIARDIDKVQMLYKMLKLIKSGTIQFEEERIKEFWKERDRLLTSFGKHIFNTIIANNSELKDLKVGETNISAIVSFNETK